MMDLPCAYGLLGWFLLPSCGLSLLVCVLPVGFAPSSGVRRSFLRHSRPLREGCDKSERRTEDMEGVNRDMEAVSEVNG